MGWIIFIIILICIFGSSDTRSTAKTRNTGSKLSQRDVTKIRKARRRAEMDAYEDMLVYLEAFSDD